MDNTWQSKDADETTETWADTWDNTWAENTWADNWDNTWADTRDNTWAEDNNSWSDNWSNTWADNADNTWADTWNNTWADNSETYWDNTWADNSHSWSSQDHSCKAKLRPAQPAHPPPITAYAKTTTNKAHDKSKGDKTGSCTRATDNNKRGRLPPTAKCRSSKPTPKGSACLKVGWVSSQGVVGAEGWGVIHDTPLQLAQPTLS